MVKFIVGESYVICGLKYSCKNFKNAVVLAGSHERAGYTAYTGKPASGV